MFSVHRLSLPPPHIIGPPLIYSSPPHRGESIFSQEGHEESESDEDHHMDVLKHGISFTGQILVRGRISVFERGDSFAIFAEDREQNQQKQLGLEGERDFCCCCLVVRIVLLHLS